MARKASRSKARTARNISGSGQPPRDRIVGAFLAILADKPFGEIGLPEVAEAAGVTLAELRAEFGSVLSILAAHIKETDRRVLADADPDMADELQRERLFDVLMRRLELLAPHKAAIRSLMKSAMRDPALALALNTMGVRSQQWMLAAAGIGSSGPKGIMRAQGLAVLFANVLRTWVEDDDPGSARTLAALDRELARGQRMAGLLDGLCAIPERACRAVEAVRRPPRRRREPDSMAV